MLLKWLFFIFGKVGQLVVRRAVRHEIIVSDGEIFDSRGLIIDYRIAVLIEIDRQSGDAVILLRVEQVTFIFTIFDNTAFESGRRAIFALLRDIGQKSVVQFLADELDIPLRRIGKILFRP